VPLSEDEERILQEIAQQFYTDDPEFAREVGETTLYRHSARRMKWAAVGFVFGLGFLVVTLGVSFWLAFVGFVMMLASALLFERNLRKLGRVGLESVSRTMRGGGLKDAFGGAGSKVRERFRRREDGEEGQ
jgi:hypothetical protein